MSSLGLTALSPLKILGSFKKIFISFVFGIISWKCEACSWWVEIRPEMGPIYLVPGPNSFKFRKAGRIDFIPLANPNMFRGSNLLRKMGWNYPSGALSKRRKKMLLLFTTSAENLIWYYDIVRQFSLCTFNLHDQPTKRELALKSNKLWKEFVYICLFFVQDENQ